MLVCDSCRKLGAAPFDNLCDSCGRRYDTEIHFVGVWPEHKRQDTLRQMFCSRAFDCADRAHGVILINGTPRFVRDELTRTLACKPENVPLNITKKYYRNYGYSLDEYEHLFS